MSLKEDTDTLEFWFDMEADRVSDESDFEEDDDDNQEYKDVIAAGNRLLSHLAKLEHVAWCRWNGTTFVTCDQDAEGAFKVFRHPIES